jgi:hypothetical protein
MIIIAPNLFKISWTLLLNKPKKVAQIFLMNLLNYWTNLVNLKKMKSLKKVTISLLLKIFKFYLINSSNNKNANKSLRKENRTTKNCLKSSYSFSTKTQFFGDY